jgi:diadenosine tetraphosphate (Ap4A) HIT family hydrolase
MNNILNTFDLNRCLIKEYENWYLLLRKEQVTIGAMVLIEKSLKHSYSEINDESFSELGAIVKEIERVMKRKFSYDKINYLMLMMVDKEVHYHVVPRYQGSINYQGKEYTDMGWPSFPRLSEPLSFDLKSFNLLLSELKIDFCG